MTPTDQTAEVPTPAGHHGAILTFSASAPVGRLSTSQPLTEVAPVEWLTAASVAVTSAVGALGKSSSTLQQVETFEPAAFAPAAEVVARIASSEFRQRIPRARFELRQQWEGTVTEIGDESFNVTLRDLTDPETQEESAELLLEDVGEGDRPLVELGAIFYWSVGYEDTPRGRERKSIIRFRRLPGWSKRQIEAVRAATEDLSAYFLKPGSKVVPK